MQTAQFKRPRRRKDEGNALLVALLLLAAALLNIYLGGISVFSVGKDSAEEDFVMFSRITIDDSDSEVRLTLLDSGVQRDDEKNMFASNQDEPTILIYHTHTTEAYRQTEDYQYDENAGKWRTHDNEKNIVKVGETLAEYLRQKGYNVLHDTTDHEPPKLATSYSRSLATMEKYKEEYPSLKIFIDVHRDAYSTDGGATDFCEIDGVKAAKLMFVVGTGEGATGAGFGEMPDFDSNFALAEELTNGLREIDEGLARDIRVKTGRYNQHVSPMCLLVEVGHNNNTLQEALNAVKHLADVMDEAFEDKL